MAFPLVSRARFDECNAERQRFLNIILKNGLMESAAEPQDEPMAEIPEEKFVAARKQVEDQVRASLPRRAARIGPYLTAIKEAEYQKKFNPSPENKKAVAMFEQAEQEVRAKAQ